MNENAAVTMRSATDLMDGKKRQPVSHPAAYAARQMVYLNGQKATPEKVRQRQYESRTTYYAVERQVTGSVVMSPGILF